MERVERAAEQLPTQFGQWLAEQLAARRDLTSSDLAAEVGVLDGDVEDWLAGRSTPRGDECRRVAEFLGLPATEVISRCGDPSGQG